MTERRLWFVRRNGEVKGPYVQAQITRNILLGRLQPDDELSLNEKHWQQVSLHQELYPDVMQETPINDEKIDFAKIQVDERLLDQRRERQDMAQERRRTRDRRAKESNNTLVHRQHRQEVDKAFKKSDKRSKMPVLSVLLIVIAVVGFVVVLKPENDSLKPDCILPAAKGVNWANCTFVNIDIENQNLEQAILTDTTFNESNLLGVNLSDSNMAYTQIIRSDLSYANLEKVRLTGANLQYTDLRYANLKDADLSYADLSHALLAGANIADTIFDNAIWIDGQKCKKGSVGSCR